jgi:CDP-diacylglycerol---serine O-phosphatidyltransferase
MVNGGRLQRGVIIVPSAFTLGNLFLGIWAIVAASRREFTAAAWLIVWAAVLDTLDGRVARYTQTGSRFGEELDSLVDAISFGVAPALIIYFTFLFENPWGWIAAWFYVASAVIRLARFNVEQAGHAKAAFHGLPSPSAGMTLATFYPFSQTKFFADNFAHLPWQTVMTVMLFVLSLLMMSHVLYPVVPKVGFRTARGIGNGIFLLANVVMATTIPALFFFPMSIGYVAYGIIKSFALGLFERLPERDPLLDEDPDEAGAELRDISYQELSPPRRFGIGNRRRRRRGRRRGDRPDRGKETDR